MKKAMALLIGHRLYCGKCGGKLATVAEAGGGRLKCPACGTVNSAAVKDGQAGHLPLEPTENTGSSGLENVVGVLSSFVVLTILQLFLFAATFGLSGRESIDVAVLVLGSPVLVALKLVVGGLLLVLSWWVCGKLLPANAFTGRPASLGLGKAMRIVIVPTACDLVLKLVVEILEDTPIPIERLGVAPRVVIVVVTFVSLVIALKRAMPTSYSRALGVASAWMAIAVFLAVAVVLSMSRFEY